MRQTFQKLSLSHDAAVRAMNAALSRATALGASVTVAVLDESGLLKATARMVGAPVVNAS